MNQIPHFFSTDLQAQAQGQVTAMTLRIAGTKYYLQKQTVKSNWYFFRLTGYSQKSSSLSSEGFVDDHDPDYIPGSKQSSVEEEYNSAISVSSPSKTSSTEKLR